MLFSFPCGGVRPLSKFVFVSFFFFALRWWNLAAVASIYGYLFGGALLDASSLMILEFLWHEKEDPFFLLYIG